jgi:hypothetical protein
LSKRLPGVRKLNFNGGDLGREELGEARAGLRLWLWL